MLRLVSRWHLACYADGIPDAGSLARCGAELVKSRYCRESFCACDRQRRQMKLAIGYRKERLESNRCNCGLICESLQMHEIDDCSL